MAALRTFAFLDRETIPDEREPSITTDCIRLYRLVREVAAARREDEAREEALRALVLSMEAVYPKKFDDNPNAWRRARRLKASAEQICLPNKELESLSDNEEFRTALIELLKSMRSYHEGVATALQQALRLSKRVKAVLEKVMAATKNPDATTLIRALPRLEALGGLLNLEIAHDPDTLRLRSQIEAQLLSEGLLPILDTLGLENAHTYQVRNELARLLLDTGDADNAHKLAETALSAYEKRLGKSDPWTKDSASVSADALDALGRADEAAALRARYGLEGTARP